MYQTVLKKAEGGYAVGANGEELRLIGPFQIRAGQRVWTDGKVIFGYVRPKSSEFVFPTLDSGIPVLCDNRKGYFTKKGVWKNYPLAEHDFIVNNKNIFFGGDEINQQGEKIFDAVINDENKIFVARCLVPYTVVFADVSVIVRGNLKVYCNEEFFSVFDFENLALQFGNSLKEIAVQHAKGTTIDNNIFDEYGEFPSHSDYHFGYLNFDIQSVEIDKNGNLDFFVFCAGYIRAYHWYTTEEVEGTHTVAVTRYTDKIVDYNYYDVEYDEIGAYVQKMGKVRLENLAHGTTFRESNGVIYKAIEPVYETITEYEEVPTIKTYSVTENYNSSVTKLYHVKGNVVEEIFKSVTDDDKKTSEGEFLLSQDLPDGSYTLDKFGRITFYDSEKKVIAKDLPIDENFCYYEIKNTLKKIDKGGSIITESKNLVEIYTPNGEIAEIETPPLGGVFKKISADVLERIEIKPIIKKLSDGKYLFGNHGGKLYLKAGDNIQEVGNNFKNFRLEELKNIKKAKSKE